MHLTFAFEIPYIIFLFGMTFHTDYPVINPLEHLDQFFQSVIFLSSHRVFYFQPGEHHNSSEGNPSCYQVSAHHSDIFKMYL